MCGIVGMVCKSQYGFSKKQEDAFWHLLKADEVRGEDSTGIIYVESDGGFGIMKEAQAATWAYYSMYTDGMVKASQQRGKVYIGHNRKATVGKVNEANAHPFVVDDTFAMVHNGSLYGHKKLKDTEVDSEALAHHLKPLLTGTVSDEELNEEMGKIDGAFAIASYDQGTNCVYLLRNKERPLSLCMLPDGWAWASEGLMLAWILSRNGYDLSKCEGIDVPVDTILTLNLDKNTISKREYQPKKATAKATTGTNTKPWPMVTTTTTKQAPRFRQDGGVSKNQFKQLRKKFIGTRHSFWADDFIEKGFATGRTLADGETVVRLLGEFDGTDFEGIPCAIHAEVDLVTVFGANSYDEGSITNRYYHGRVADMIYHKGPGSVVFLLEDVKVFPRKTDVSTEVTKLLETTQGKWNASTPPAVH